jgi:hypothetical protein
LIDRAFLRKSSSYAMEQVAAGRADWVDSADPAKGIVVRELIYFGPKTTSIPLVDDSRPCNDRALGLRFIPAANAGQTLGHVHPSILCSRDNWDWSKEAC